MWLQVIIGEREAMVGRGRVLNFPKGAHHELADRECADRFCWLAPLPLEPEAQRQMLAAVREIFAAAPLFTPRMPKSGRPFTVRMSNCGPLGWVSDEHG
jgi:alkylated DNA repair dioxygenase AlkB